MNIAGLDKACQVTLQTCLGLKPKESLLIVTDDQAPAEIGQALFEEARKLGVEVMWLQMVARQLDGQELPAAVAQALLQVDAFLGPTSKSFSHTNSRRAASKAGVRGATLPGVTLDLFIRLMQSDYHTIARQAKQLVELINQQQQAHLTSSNGTDLQLELKYQFEPDDGILQAPGSFGNLPAGEVMGAPSNASGVVVFDTMGEIITQPTRLVIEQNQVVEIEDNPSGKRLQQLLDQAVQLDGNRNAYQLAELGIGLNPLAQVSGNVLEDEKVLGTCHLAVGDNSSYPGGTNVCSIHMDGIILKPSLTIGSTLVLDDGQL